MMPMAPGKQEVVYEFTLSQPEWATGAELRPQMLELARDHGRERGFTVSEVNLEDVVKTKDGWRFLWIAFGNWLTAGNRN